MAREAFISATKLKVTVNAKELLRELTVDSPNNKKMAVALRKVIGPKIEERQKELSRKFEAHPITVELNAGPRASNTSGTLGGYGNLFSFIGFPAGNRPTEVISRIFKEKIKFKIRRMDKRGKYIVTFFIPDIQEIYSLTPIPWLAGKSWVQGVETGLTNLGQYIYSASGFGSSSSGTGDTGQKQSFWCKF